MPPIELLPKGRHGLSREQVATSQRTRLLQAAVELGTKHGFATMTLADLVGRAGVSRATFYEHFADKQDCFMQAFDYAADRVVERVLAMGLPPKGEVAMVGHIYIARMLEVAVEEPGLVRLVAADALTLGPEAAVHQRATRSRIAEGLVQLRDRLRRNNPEAAPITHTRALSIVGALSEPIQHTLQTAGIDGLPALHAELSASLIALIEAPPA